MRKPALLIGVCLCACAAGAPLEVRLVSGPDDSPFSVGSVLSITVERDGVAVGESSTTPLSERSIELPELPFGSQLTLRAEARSGPTTFARGRSFPFDALDGPPIDPPHITIGTLGRATRTLRVQPSGRPLAIRASPGGADFATTRGLLYHYAAHGGEEGQASLEVRGRLPSHRESGTVVASGLDRWLVVGGRVAGATLISGDGAVLDELSNALLPHRSGSAVVELQGGHLLLGGRVDGALSPEVTWIPQGDVIAPLARSPLPIALADALAVVVELEDAEGALVEQVLVLAGTSPAGPSGDALLVDPSGQRLSRAFPLGLDRDLRGASAASVGRGLVLLAGGGPVASPSDRVELLLVTRDAVTPLMPAPGRLAQPRTEAAVVRFGLGLALIVGGRGAFQLPLASAELFHVRGLEDLPGDVVPTGHLPLEAAAPLGTVLGDGTVLVVEDGLLAVYFSPRGP